MTITHLDKTTLRFIREQINDALAGSIEGLELRAGNCSYSGNIATFKLEVKIEGADSKEMQDLRRYADMYDIDLEKTHPVYTLVGYLPRSSKYPFLVKKAGADGTYKITEETAKRYFGKDAA
jgi:hypothetical protein